MRRDVLHVAWLLLVALGLSTLCRPADAVIYTYGVKLTATQIQASREGKGGAVEVDPAISDGIKSMLFREYKLKYMTYTKLSEDTRQVSLGAEQEYAVAGKTVKVTIVSHRQRILNFKIQVDLKYLLPKVIHGEHYLMKFGSDPDPVIFVLSPELIQVTR